MRIAPGDTLPDATLLRMGADGVERVELSSVTAGRKVVLFGLPGPFTGTCTSAHVPSFLRVRDALGEEGIDEVVCFAVSDPFVMAAWSEATGAGEGGLTMLADADGSFTKAIGLGFDAPAVGFHGRTIRHSMLVMDGTVELLHLEDRPGVCEMTAGETMLEAVRG